jgi:hypothetical protein
MAVLLLAHAGTAVPHAPTQAAAHLMAQASHHTRRQLCCLPCACMLGHLCCVCIAPAARALLPSLRHTQPPVPPPPPQPHTPLGRRVYARVGETWQGNVLVQGIKNLADAVSNKVRAWGAVCVCLCVCVCVCVRSRARSVGLSYAHLLVDIVEMSAISQPRHFCVYVAVACIDTHNHPGVLPITPCNTTHTHTHTRQVSAATGAVSLGFMRRDMESTAEHAAAEAATSQAASEGPAAPDASAAIQRVMAGGAPPAQARATQFKHPLLQVCSAGGRGGGGRGAGLPVLLPMLVQAWAASAGGQWALHMCIAHAPVTLPRPRAADTPTPTPSPFPCLPCHSRPRSPRSRSCLMCLAPSRAPPSPRLPCARASTQPPRARCGWRSTSLM